VILYEEIFNLLSSQRASEVFLNIRQIHKEGTPVSTRKNITPLKITILNHYSKWDLAEKQFIA